MSRPAFGRAEVLVSLPTKLKKKKKKKQRVKLDPRTPAAARLINRRLTLNRRQSKKPPSLRLRGLMTTREIV